MQLGGGTRRQPKVMTYEQPSRGVWSLGGGRLQSPSAVEFVTASLARVRRAAACRTTLLVLWLETG
jgi:hypothetical protein